MRLGTCGLSDLLTTNVETQMAVELLSLPGMFTELPSNAVPRASDCERIHNVRFRALGKNGESSSLSPESGSFAMRTVLFVDDSSDLCQVIEQIGRAHV